MADASLRYSKDHEWVKVEGDVAIIGITNYAQEQLGDIVYVELPELSAELDKDEVACAVESVKTAADVLTPVSGTVAAINEDLEDQPELINEDPYEAWIMQIEMSDPTEVEALMNEAEYASYCEEEE